jgi:HTH-type transcriptional regulator/antitoxin HipB
MKRKELMAWTNSYSLKQTGAFLKSERKQRGLTQDEFAAMLGVSHATVSSLENGGTVSAKTLEKALNFLGLRIVIVPKSAVVTVVEPKTPSEEGQQ